MYALKKQDILHPIHNDYDSSTCKGFALVDNERTLQNYAEELVAHYAKYDCDQYELSLDDLSDYQKDELARLYIEASDRDLSECIYGDDFTINNDFTCAILAMLKQNSPRTRQTLAEVTRKNILIYHAQALQKILDEACDYFLHNNMNEQGHYARYDRDHGDLIWTR